MPASPAARRGNRREKNRADSIEIGHNIGQEFVVGELLGKGGYGRVFKCLNTVDGSVAAIKVIRWTKVNGRKKKEIMKEFQLLEELEHQNILKLKSSRTSKDFLYIILEFIENGSLAHILKKYGIFPERLVARYIEQTLEGLQYLHDSGVVHRDIKGGNILANKDGTVKLCDFGLASRLKEISELDLCGTPYWMAPEVIEMREPTYGSDIWAVGCTIIELITGGPPFIEMPPMSALYHIVSSPDGPAIPPGISEELKHFISRCFIRNPAERPTAQELLRDPWLVKHALPKTDITKSKETTSTDSPVPGVDRWEHDLRKIKKYNENLKGKNKRCSNFF